jgi:hypothetical protein
VDKVRLHGGKGSAAPKANRNDLRRGLYTKEVLAREAELRDVRQRPAVTIAVIEDTQKTPFRR